MKERGITLIALVITIIVLLILAGVSIAMLTGDNGILTKGNEAQTKTVHQQVYEELKLKVAEYVIDSNADAYSKTLIDYLTEKQYISEAKNGEGYIINVINLNGEKLKYGNGTDEEKDVYKLEEIADNGNMTKIASMENVKIANTKKQYKVTYYGKNASENVTLGTIEDNIKNVKSDIINFTIDGESYKAKEGMTWSQWIGSEYDTSSELYIYEYTNLVEPTDRDISALFLDGTKQYGDTVIQDGADYCIEEYCFLAGTKVLTPEGLIDIEKINSGDEVYTRNEKTNTIETKKVLKRKERNYNLNIINIYTQNANVKSTDNHTFYVKNQGWVRADKLKEGDILINSNNAEMPISKIEIIENNETIKVYNLDIEDNDNYFVGLDSILVHNSYCIVAGSKVIIDLKGTTKPIEELKVGDTVLSFNESTQKNELKKVTQTYIHKDATDIVTIKFKDGTEIIQNMYHPIYTKQGWKSLTKYNGYEILEKDDKVKTEQGWKEIESININLNSEPIDLYTISVEGNSNFYANGTLMYGNKY